MARRITSLEDHVRMARRIKQVQQDVLDLARLMKQCGIPKAQTRGVYSAADIIATRRWALEDRMFKQHPQLRDVWLKLYGNGTDKDMDSLENSARHLDKKGEV